MKVGDRVRVIEGDGVVGENAKGSVLGMMCNTVAVEFDKPFPGGHSCSGKCPKECGRYMLPGELEKINTKK